MTIELKQYALSLAIGVAKPDEALPLAQQFYAWLANDGANDAAPADDKPKRTRAKAEPAAATDAAPAASKLEPADEGNVGADKVDATPAPAATETATASADDKPASPTRDDALTAATKFSQTHGVEALEAALGEVGAKKFSDVPADRYAEFIHEMTKYDQKRDVLS